MNSIFSNKKLLISAVLIILAALSRLIPHPINVAPFAAIALFSAVYINDIKLVVIIPLGALFLSDIVMNIVDPSFQYGTINLVMYGAFAFTIGIGLLLKRKLTITNIVSASFASSVLFFIITNFAVWAGWELYAKSLEGLQQCYIAALPFFRNSLIGDLFYTTALFGCNALVQRFIYKKAYQEN